MTKIPLKVIHYGTKNPLITVGGVETFARNLALVFDNVVYMTPGQKDIQFAVQNRIPVICDNQLVVDWPEEFPVIGFQHGVAQIKWEATRSLAHRWLLQRQAKASKRPHTLWVACADWVSHAFGERFGNRADYVVYYRVDVDKFDGRRTPRQRLILHDARKRHKGSAVLKYLTRVFSDWRIEPLDCPPDQVADRMREARAFVHLSRYEGNSLVCNEAMAMDLPCFFTRVGLMRDRRAPTEVYVVDPDPIFISKAVAKREFTAFLQSLETREYHPRPWVMEHASHKINLEAWRQVMSLFGNLSGWDLEIASK